MMYLSRSKASLFLGASFLVLAVSAPAMAQQTAEAAPESVIVTGTRVTGMSAADSAAPITVIGNDAFTHVGAPDLRGALLPTVPSFDAEAHGGDTGTLFLSARLRGLNPNHTLVLVNGKRRHGTANLHVLPGAFQGAASPDLDLIALPAISRIEVLQDGAAAQYGSDAVAGVVNIILKKNDSGGSFSATGGQYYRGDGSTYDFAGNIGFDLGGKGFLSITGEKRFRGFTQRTGPSARVATATGAPLPGVPFDVTKTPDFPYAGNNIGDPESQLTTVFYNSEYEILPDLTLYSFGSYGHRNAKSFGSYRAPNQAGFIATQFSDQRLLPPGSTNPGCGNGIVPASGVNACFQTIPNGSYTSPGELIFSTSGFRPQIGLNEDDYGYTVGANGKVDGWNWDLSGTYGKDINKLTGLQTGNGSLFVNTHQSPSSFYLGSFRASELTGNLDVNKTFNVGLASPLSVAFGFEARENTYAITLGEPASYYGIGAANFPGFGPTSALSHSRKNYSQYIDFAVSPVADLQIDVAGRHEHYTDFGDTTVGKITARYDFNPAIAVRGTAASGFRAPTLAEEYYTQTNVTPTSATVTLGPNSVGAAAEGIAPLGPENSVNYSIGLVTHLWDNFSATVDFYSIAIGNRIVGTGTAPCKSNNVVISVPVCNALVANGNVLDPSVVTTGTTVFTNSVSTITQGVDLTANYRSDFEDWGRVNWTVAANWGETRISSQAPNPPALAGVPLQTPSSIANLTSLSPKFKFVLGALWNIDDWTLNVREVVYGPTRAFVTPGSGGTASQPVFYVVNGANYYQFKTPTTGITDIDISYAFTDHLSLTVGANNVFDQNAPVLGLQTNGQPLDAGSVYLSPQNQTPYGINGGFYFGRVNITW
jgi:iron complex outermembrane receptor protein